MVAFLNWMYAGGAAPASRYVVNTGGCQGIDIWDYCRLACYMFASCDLPDCDHNEPCPPTAGEGSVSVDHVDGAFAEDSLLSDETITFHIRLTNYSTSIVTGMINGFRVYSPTGADWDHTTVSQIAEWNDLDFQGTRTFGITGNGADTVGYYGMIFMPQGLSGSYDAITHTISIGPIDPIYEGGTICLDTCWYPPIGQWLWSMGYVTHSTIPSWDGPHCFTIASCCDPRGDIDHSGVGPDIADLVYIVSYMFQDGPAPACPEKADINGDSIGPDIADLVYLVTFMFQNGPPPVPCE